MDQLQKRPQDFVDGIVRRLVGGGDFGVGNHANVVTVMDSQHADVFRLYGSHGNFMIDLSKWSRSTLELAGHRPDIVRDYIDRARRELDRLEQALDDTEMV